MIITIDGPAGSGKSTAARNLARHLGLAFLDTGATYRAVTLKALREGVDMGDEAALADVARRADIRLVAAGGGLRVLLDGDDVSEVIRTEQVSRNSGQVARSAAVREVLVQLQREIGSQLGEFVTEGRDQGSVVFPQAQIKFFLEASPQVRAQRRCEELRRRGQTASFEDVLAGILERDHRDSTREVAPLRPPEDAVRIDTSENTIEQTTAQLVREVEARR